MVERNTEEPHIQSSSCLVRVVKADVLLNIWRVKCPNVRQYTWVKINNERVSAARLDKIYISKTSNSQLTECSIIPTSLTDHKLVLIAVSLSQSVNKSSLWYLILDYCKYFGKSGKIKKVLLKM